MYRSRVIFERHQEQTIAFVRMALAMATGTHQELLTLPQKVLLSELKKDRPHLLLLNAGNSLRHALHGGLTL